MRVKNRIKNNQNQSQFTQNQSKINPKLVQNQSKIDPKSLQNCTLARESIFHHFWSHFGPPFGPILDQCSTQKRHQKHVENNMQKCSEKGTPLDVSGALFNVHFCSKCQVFSERFSSIELEHAFYTFRSFFEPLDPQKTLYLCSKTRISASSAFLA